MPTVMQWTLHLLAKIAEQQRYAKPYEARYRNQHVLPFIANEYREVYGTAVDHVLPSLRPPQAGIAAIGIDALSERMTVLGGTSEDPQVAQRIQAAWEDNDLDVMHREATREALIKARSFASLHRSADGARAIVGIESPEQMAVHRQAAPPYDVDASLKIGVDEWTGKRTGLLRIDGIDIDLVEDTDVVRDPDGSTAQSRWVIDTNRPNNGVTETRLLGVPVAEFTSRPRLLAEPISEIEPITTFVDLADLIEGLMVFAGHFGAVPIRYATGITVPRDPSDKTKPLLGSDGKPMISFKPRADHFWADTNPDAKFGQLTPAVLDSFVTWADHASARIRAQTSVASTYYSLDLKSHMSAELLKTDEAPMVRRVLSMGRDGAFNQSWRRVLRYILMIEDPSSTARVQPRWADPETRVEAQATDSFQKVVASGVGPQFAAEKILGWSPEEAQRAIDEGAEVKAAAAAAGDPALERMADKLLNATNPVPAADAAA